MYESLPPRRPAKTSSSISLTNPSTTAPKCLPNSFCPFEPDMHLSSIDVSSPRNVSFLWAFEGTSTLKTLLQYSSTVYYCILSSTLRGRSFVRSDVRGGRLTDRPKTSLMSRTADAAPPASSTAPSPSPLPSPLPARVTSRVRMEAVATSSDARVSRSHMRTVIVAHRQLGSCVNQRRFICRRRKVAQRETPIFIFMWKTSHVQRVDRTQRWSKVQVGPVEVASSNISGL